MSLRVLVIEDEADLRLSLGLALRVAGHEVEEAATGTEGLRRLTGDTSLPDAVLLDLRLPDIDGWDILEQLALDGLLPELPVVVGSADADPEARRRARDAGCLAYLVKPFEPEDLLGALRPLTTPHEGR